METEVKMQYDVNIIMSEQTFVGRNRYMSRVICHTESDKSKRVIKQAKGKRKSAQRARRRRELFTLSGGLRSCQADPLPGRHRLAHLRQAPTRAVVQLYCRSVADVLVHRSVVFSHCWVSTNLISLSEEKRPAVYP